MRLTFREEWHLPMLNTPAITKVYTLHITVYRLQIPLPRGVNSLLPLPLRLIARALLLIDEAGFVPPMPPDAFVKVEIVVKEEEDSGSRPKRRRTK